MFTLAHILRTVTHPRPLATGVTHHTPIDVTTGALAASFQIVEAHEFFERRFVGDFVTVVFAILLSFFVRFELVVSCFGSTMEN